MSECIESALRRCGLRNSLTLKPEQLKSLEVVLAGSHVIAVLPTGFGKSLIYQLLPFAFDLQTDSSSSCLLVVSPLVALMVQQVERARRLGLNSAKERKATGEGLGSSSSRKDGYVWVLVVTT